LAAVLDAGPYVQFRTPIGDIEVDLYDDKPVTTQNFIRYVEAGLYRDMFLHRWVPRFVIQGGGYSVTNRGRTNAQAVAIPSVFGQITNEFNVGRRASNVFATIAMAKNPTGPNTATSEFFFNLANNSTNLDTQNGGFTVFGRVVRGTNILGRFNNLSPTNRIYLASFNPPFEELPVLSTNLNEAIHNVVFCDITLLNVRVRAVQDGAREISWNSVTNRLNRVEYTTNLPPAWHQLIATNGNGQTVRVTDANLSAPSRFYRVRVDF
jgi:cyclophilin family peptidyl-prolyl cis-trans isomerase